MDPRGKGEGEWPKEVDAGSPLLVASIAAADSTALFCCKGETWIPLAAVEQLDGVARVGAEPGAPPLFVRGGNAADLEKALGPKAGELALPSCAPFARYERPGLPVLLVAARDGRIERMLLETELAGETLRVELDVLRPGEPVKELWKASLTSDWSFPPADRLDYERRKRRGHLR